MTLEEKIEILSNKIQNNNTLLFVLKKVVINALPNVDEAQLDVWLSAIDQYESNNITFAIESARNFGNSLTAQFAIENVAAGITQTGKSRQVADFLKDLERYLRNGSLYVAIEEINRIIGEGVPSELDPFVNEGKLVDYRGRIQQYLGIPVTPNE